MLYRLKGRFQTLAQKFASSSLTANQATILGILFIFASSACFYLGQKNSLFLFLNPIFIFLRFVMNALDGMLARAQNTASPLGEIVNEFSDVLGDTMSYGILLFIFPEHQAAILLFLLSLWCCEFIGVLGKSLPNGQRRQESFGGGKPERALWLAIFSLVWALQPDFARNHLGDYLYFVSLLVFFSAFLRIKKALRMTKGQRYTSTTNYGR